MLLNEANEGGFIWMVFVQFVYMTRMPVILGFPNLENENISKREFSNIWAHVTLKTN